MRLGATNPQAVAVRYGNMPPPVRPYRPSREGLFIK